MTERLKATTSVFMRYRHLLYNLVSRDFKVKYRRSMLGMLWSILNPLLMMLVMTVVFQNIFKMGGSNLPIVAKTGLPPNFSAYLITGQVILNFFSDATNSAMNSVFGNAALIKKVYIPKYIFPLEKVLFSLLNAGFSMIALALVFIFTKSSVSWWLLLFPIPLILLFVFNYGVGLILSAGVVFFRDIQHLYGVFILGLTYLTPVFYDENVMFGGESIMKLVIRFNPLYWYLGMFRQLVLYGVPPSLNQWLITIGCSVAALLIGLAVFYKSQDKFVLYI